MFAVQRTQLSSAAAAADEDSTFHHRSFDRAAITSHARNLGKAASYDDKGRIMLADAGILSTAAGQDAMDTWLDKLSMKEGYEAARIPRSGSRKRAVQEEDVGGLFMFSSSQLSSTCTEGYIDCDNGKVRGSDQSCKDACDGKCCIGGTDWMGGYLPACDGFTGKVCKDMSCSGLHSCHKASILYVVNSCSSSGNSCVQASISGSMVNSCNSYASCGGLGLNGAVGNVTGSCNYVVACINLGRNGTAGNVQNSCNQQRSCSNLGREGKVGNILDSCTGGTKGYTPGYETCSGLGYGGKVGNVVNSCTELHSCFELGRYGEVGNIENSCNETSSCEKFSKRGAVGNVKDSCNEESACQNGGRGTPSKFGKIAGGIDNSCNAFSACSGAGQTSCSNFQCSELNEDEKSCEGICMMFGGGISSKLNGCCNSNSTCVNADEYHLPMACRPPTNKVRRRTMHAFFGHHENPSKLTHHQNPIFLSNM